MDDLTGLGKVIESQLARDLYQDAFAGGAKQVGATLEDTAKALRLFLAPIRLLAMAHDRLERYCEKASSAVPKERQIEASPSIAGPILIELRFMEEGNPIAELYVNLLSRAIDRDRKDEAHPAFVKIIGLLSPIEALLLNRLGLGPFTVHFYFDTERGGWNSNNIVASEFQSDELELLAMSLDRLRLLGLLDYDAHHQNIDFEAGRIMGNVELTQFGRMFYAACNP